MARIRTIKPELFTSASMAQVSVEARYVLVGLLTEADDDGRFLASSKRLAGVLFPHDEVIGSERVEDWLKELEAVGTIQLYEVNGVRYGALPGFSCHQRISPTKYRASTLPEPVSAGQSDGSQTADTWQTDGSHVADTRQTHGRHVAANPRREVEVEVEREVERKGKGKGNIALARSRDELFEVVAEVCGIDWGELTDTARGALNKAVAQLRALEASPEEIRRRAANWPYDVPLTPPGLAKHWPALGTARASGSRPNAALALAAQLRAEGR